MIAASALIALGSVAMVRVPTLSGHPGGAGDDRGRRVDLRPGDRRRQPRDWSATPRMARRTGRNEAFNHAGNVIAAILAGLIGDHVAYEGIFYLLAGMCGASAVATLMIRRDEIDDDLARGAVPSHGDESDPGRTTPYDRPARRAVRGPSHPGLRRLGRALPLRQRGDAPARRPEDDRRQDRGRGRLHVGLHHRGAARDGAGGRDRQPAGGAWGRRPAFLVGFAVLPVRGLLYTLTADPWLLVAVQLLDGIGAGIFGVVGILVIADLTRGTGRFNLMQGRWPPRPASGPRPASS